jgi:uncharacterized protein
VIICFICSFTGCEHSKEIIHRFPTGEVSEKYILFNNMYQGRYLSYFENGQLRSEGYYSKNKMTGTWHYFYPGGKIMSIQEFKQGKLLNINAWDVDSNSLIINGTGTFILYYANGSRMSRVTYKACKQDGVWISWFENGKLASEVCYDFGKPIGIWRFWDQDGSLSRIENKDQLQ